VDSFAQPSLKPKEKPSLQFRCPRCEEMFLFRAEDIPPGGTPLTCPHCRLDFRRRVEPQDKGKPVETCWLCGRKDLYVQKDFNQVLGLLIVLASAFVSLLVFVVIDHFLGIACIVILGVADLTVYHLLSKCTVCYLCRSIYRGFPVSPRHEGFFAGNDQVHEKSREVWLRGLLGGSSPGESRPASP